MIRIALSLNQGVGLTVNQVGETVLKDVLLKDLQELLSSSHGPLKISPSPPRGLICEKKHFLLTANIQQYRKGDPDVRNPCFSTSGKMVMC